MTVRVRLSYRRGVPALTCRFCAGPMPHDAGRRALYCCPAHRQAAYQVRRNAAVRSERRSTQRRIRLLELEIRDRDALLVAIARDPAALDVVRRVVGVGWSTELDEILTAHEHD